MTALVSGSPAVRPLDVHDMLRRSLLVDGFDLVLDLERSAGSRLVDARDGTAYLDLFAFFASSALGMNHPGLVEDAVFREELLTAAMNKPSNSDVYSQPMARFVATFARVLGDPGLPHLFFVEGGALAVENALKVAFDWKSRWNEAHGIDPALGTKVLHLRDAFHGRSGYTMSLTNTDPVKVARFPQFDWPRISTRARRILEVIESGGLIARAADLGPVLLALLRDLATKHPEVTDVRGRGLMCAFSLPDAALRDAALTALREDEHVLLLGCGTRSVRFRPARTVSADELAEGVGALDRVLTRLTSSNGTSA